MSISVERWGIFEYSLQGPNKGNPFLDQSLYGVFTGEKEELKVEGFYDGDGTYRIRFMPSYTGDYSFVIHSTFLKAPVRGSFTSVKPSGNNRGPVRVANTYHFAYEDGTPHYSNGTTAYAFALQDRELLEKTLGTLSESGFNKMRFCVFPKHYDFCLTDPEEFPFEGTPMDASVLTRDNFAQYTGNPPGNDWNFSRPNPKYFKRLDFVVNKLMEMGIEADLILFHAYDRWGFSKMPPEARRFYLRYIAARYSAFRNIWWALANEYELVGYPEKAWDALAEEFISRDPYHHLISIHNCERFYDYTKSWITHCSCQRTDHHKTTEFTLDLRKQYGKPIVWDEVGYEGDLPHCWGNFTPEELVRRAWEAAIRGGYCGHSETYLSDDNIIWWAHGGSLKGESAERFRFLYDILRDTPGTGLKRWEFRDDYRVQWDDYIAIPEEKEYFDEYYLYYYSIWRPSFRQIWVNDTTLFDVEIIDTWNMTITPFGQHRGKFDVPLPRKQYMAVRLKKVKERKSL